MVQTEIITIGDEILIGQTVDTNSAWMGEKLNEIGINVKQITSISDDREHILTALKEAENRAEIILITGGLGPTKDDITKKTLCEYFDAKLVLNEDLLEHVKKLFESRGFRMSEVNIYQAEVPENCIPITNNFGTAPAMWFESRGKIFVSMPGVPYEMKAMMESDILPKLKERFKTYFIIHKTALTQGIGESFLMEKIGEWESSLEESNIKLAYLPTFGSVKLRLTKSGNDKVALEKEIEEKITELEALIPKYFYGAKKETLQQVIGKILNEQKQYLSTAESCTGGYVAHLLTSVPGSSNYFAGSIVCYSNEVKINQLGIRTETLEKNGAVSQQVVEEMALGAKQQFRTDYAIATSGIAGPSGGTSDKPVGTVWIAISSPNGVISKKHLFGNDRIRNIKMSTDAALNMLRNELMKSGQSE
ncbi:MAG: competence/damage-inducible protein A [Flavobacteriales bacterium]|nr:MAG: competence/damage-inducible protein A [Flavobacteriales bacterium]